MKTVIPQVALAVIVFSGIAFGSLSQAEESAPNSTAPVSPDDAVPPVPPGVAGTPERPGGVVTPNTGPDAGVPKPGDGNLETDTDPPRTMSSPDEALVRLKTELERLSAGKPPISKDIDSLFSVPLEDIDAVTGRLKQLPAERLQLEERLDQLDRQLATPDALVPAVPRPDLLGTPPTAPTAPEAPIAPEKPDRAAIRAYQKSKRETPDAATADPRTVYKAALAQYEQDVARYQLELKAYEASQAEHEEALARYRSVKAEYENARQQRERAVAEKTAALRVEVSNLEARIAVAKLRMTYLSALAELLKRLSEPALEMFGALKTPRLTLRKRAEMIQALTAEAQDLQRRVRTLYHRAEAGSLVGFQVQQDEVSRNLAMEVRSFDNRIKKGRLLADALVEVANEIETDSRAQRAHILVTVCSPDIKAVMDRTFQNKLRESRRASRVTTGFAVTDTALMDAQARLNGLLERPKSITAVADGEKVLMAIRAAGEQLDGMLDAIMLGLERHRQAYKREVVTIYSSLASPEVKNRAYSFSYAFLEDFIADMNLLRVDLSLWAEARLGSIATITDNLRTVEGKLRIARVSGGLLLIVFLVIMRTRIRRRLARLILRMINLKTFKRRAGLLVRLTVFILALSPIALWAISGYALIFLIGIEYPEVKIAEIAFRWALIYIVGRQVVLGLTRKERSGRPPLFDISLENFKLLRVTYARLGLFLAMVAAADEWSREWMGTGSLNTMVRLVATAWLGVWILWAMFAWRRSLAKSCGDTFQEWNWLRRLAAFSESHRVGVLLTPFLFVLLLAWSLFRAARKLMAEGNLLAYLRARALRRLSKKAQRTESIVPALALPERYTEQFPLYPLHGEEGEVLLPRQKQIETVRDQIARWQTTGQDGSLVLVGEKGIGKTTFLALLEREIPDVRVTRHIFAKKLRSEQELVEDMKRSLHLDETDVPGLARHFNDQAPQVILLDEAHNIFIRTVGGFSAVNALVNLVDATSTNVFWVLVFNSYSWSFLKKASNHVRAFRKVLRLPPWSQAELKALVAKRNERSGLSVEFDEVLLDAETSSTGGFELISSADGFFRLLWEASRGNPRVATYLWLNALTALSDRRIRVGLIREEDAELLSDLGSGMMFALASMVQHENLSFEELGRALNIPSEEAVYAARYLIEYGLLEPKHTDPKRFTLAPRFHQQVLRTLRNHHLLYAEEP